MCVCSRSNSDNSNYHKPGGGARSGSRSNNESQSIHDRGYNNVDNIPPRLRNAAQRERTHKEKRTQSGHNNHYNNSTHMSSVPRRSANHPPQQQRANSSSGTSSANGVTHLPHNNRGANSGSITSGHEHRVDRTGKDYPNNRQSAAGLPHAHNRNHGAHAHRNSVSFYL